MVLSNQSHSQPFQQKLCGQLIFVRVPERVDPSDYLIHLLQYLSHRLALLSSRLVSIFNLLHREGELFSYSACEVVIFQIENSDAQPSKSTFLDRVPETNTILREAFFVSDCFLP